MNLIRWTRTPEQEAEFDSHMAEEYMKRSKSKYDYNAQMAHQITGLLDFDPHFDMMDNYRINE